MFKKTNNRSSSDRFYVFQIDNALEHFFCARSSHHRAVIGALRLIDDDERQIFGLFYGKEPHERRNVFPHGDLTILKNFRRACFISYCVNFISQQNENLGPYFSVRFG